MRISVLLAALLFLSLCPVATADEGGVAIVRWNEGVLRVAEAEDGFLTLKGLRTAALMHLAMHDALNSSEARYSTYLAVDDNAEQAMNVAVTAAFAIAADQYPNQIERFEALHEQTLVTSLSDADERLGKAIAEAVIESRQGDGWDGQPEYQWHPMAPGVYAEFSEHSGTPEGFIFGAGWARATGFALSSPEQFVSPPPPAIGSDEYAQAYDEVRRLGRFQSMERTPDQTHIALWWKDFVENSHNRLARDLVVREGLDAPRSARLFALLNMSIFDAYVASFANKFHYNHWRPYTAIRWAEHDGNERTVADPTWNNTHRHTYAFPSYPSAHGTACAAAMTVLSDTFGADYPFVMHTPSVDIAGPFSEKLLMEPAARSFDSFQAAARECADSRVYLGIHFRYDSDAGNALGRDVGLNVIQTLLARITE